MRAAILAAIALVSVAPLAGCGTQGQPTTPKVGALRPSPRERSWFRWLGLTLSAPAATGVFADKRVESIQQALRNPGVEIVSLRIYSTPAPTPALAPALVLAVARPAYFLHHQLWRVLFPLLRSENVKSENVKSENVIAFYLRIVDARAKPVVEWANSWFRGANGSHSSLYIRPALEACFPDLWGGVVLGSCPSK
jgi:hypothetical protein